MAGAQQKTTPMSLFIGFVGCVVFPALVTAIAPVSYVRFEKQGDNVSVTSKQCLLFCVPYLVQKATGVHTVGNKVIAARKLNADERRRRRDDGRNVTVEGEGTLILTGEDGEVKVTVSPASIKTATERAEAFVKAPTEEGLSMFLVANWKFSILFGGFVSLLTPLWVVGFVLWIGQQLIRLTGYRSPGETFELVVEEKSDA